MLIINTMFIITLVFFLILIFDTTSAEKRQIEISQSKISRRKYFTDFELEHSEASTRQIFSDALLSKETLKKFSDRLRVNPAKIWNLKHYFKYVQNLKIDKSKLGKFTEHPYSKRLLRKLLKVLKGESVQLTVVGGSNSGEAGDELEKVQGIFPLVIKDWWVKAITPLTGSELELTIVNIGGTSSDFYQYCFHGYVENNLDLVIVELSANDFHLQSQFRKSVALEQLTRQLLLYPSQPALIYVDSNHGNLHQSACKNHDNYGQCSLSHAYKITSVRWCELVCAPAVTGVDVLRRDENRVNLLDHAQVSLMFINMIRKTLLKMIANQEKVAQLNSLTQTRALPRPVFIKSANKIISSPFCWTTLTPNYQNKIKNNFKVFNIKVIRNSRFEYLPLIRMGYRCDSSRVCRSDAYSGWVGSTVGATLIMSFTIPQLSPDTRSVVFATRTGPYCGKAKVWVDNDFENGKIVDAKMALTQTSVNVIALRVNPGLHTLTVSVVEPANVTVVGVMLGPPDGPY